MGENDCGKLRTADCPSGLATGATTKAEHGFRFRMAAHRLPTPFFT